VTAPALPDSLGALLRRFVQLERIILASDFDGCLSPLVPIPSDARPAPGTVEALRVAANLPGVVVAVVSGRDLATLRTLTGIGPDEPIVLIGSHGAQTSADDGGLTADQQAILGRLTAGLESIAAGYDGAHVELKPSAVALHTRPMADQEAGERALAQAREFAGAEPEAHVLSGKCVVEVAVVATSKGAALAELASTVGADATLYLGDDVTDETVFSTLDPARGDVSIKVGAGDTAAVERIAGVPDVVTVLETVVSLRQASDHA
jgi:trehalose 6-phosphate phosphatase